MVKSELPPEPPLPFEPPPAAPNTAPAPAVQGAAAVTPSAVSAPGQAQGGSKRPRFFSSTSDTRSTKAPRLSRTEFTSAEVAQIRDNFTSIVGDQHREALDRLEQGFNALAALLDERDELERKLREHMAKIEALDARCNSLQAQLVEAQLALKSALG
ncbi:hypothetical protein AURDEDRAFT_161639 [Auricularia subglabra TFB-10046 SS5]|nr:hypothetical protein AURDEDRAFT_161639 [Auricularia subglabra TFB-10046 SS5]